jgi:hypothetical protein
MPQTAILSPEIESVNYGFPTMDMPVVKPRGLPPRITDALTFQNPQPTLPHIRFAPNGSSTRGHPSYGRQCDDSSPVVIARLWLICRFEPVLTLQRRGSNSVRN